MTQRVRLEAAPLDWRAWQELPGSLRNQLADTAYALNEWDFSKDNIWATFSVCDERIVGAHIYCVRTRELRSIVTWVAHQHRRNSLGLHMWHYSIALQDLPQVRVTVCTPGGMRLVQRVQREVYVDITVINNC